MKKIITLAVGLLVASSAFASVQTTHSETSIISTFYQTKAEALDAGFDITDSLQSMTKSQLRYKLPTYASNSVRDIAIDDTQVSVEEFAVTRGEIQYRAVVDVDYHFDAKERD